MTGYDIVEQAARDTLVEKVVLAVTHRRALTYDLTDLVQIVYLALLRTEEATLQALQESGELRQYIAGIVVRQVNSPRSTWNATILRFKETGADLYEARNIPDGSEPF